MNELLDRDDQSGMQFLPESINHLRVASKWAKFIAIFGLVMTGLMLLITVFSLSNTIGFVGGGNVLFSVFYIALMFFFFLWVFQFARNSQNAIRNNNAHDLAHAMRYLKYYFVAMGIALLAWLVVLVVVLASFAVAGGNLFR
ncbi:MAG TPA: hypothetical protein VIK71_10380 [Flavobacteriales bacterium]